ncbi:LysR family transcriptional regulator [Chloroflexi bacterium TSY]|nr:LysR family transcriptional regulator [Chloroflexi bacterium TSY]
MELHQLRSFITIVRQGSFTKAADKLFVTQSALSQQIKALEQKLGVSLFEHPRRRIYLTQAGEILRSRAEKMLRLEAEVQEELDGLAGLTRGRLRIGTSDTTCLYLLPTVVRQFRHTYPSIEIHLTNRPSSEVVAALQDGEIEFGIVTLPPNSVSQRDDGQRLASLNSDRPMRGTIFLDRHKVDLDVQHLFWREDILITPPNHPLTQQPIVTVQNLVDYPLLLLERGSSSRAFLDQLFDAAAVVPRIIDLGSIEVIKRYVEIDLGISIIPRLAVEEEVQANQLQATTLAWLPEREVGWVQRHGAELSPAGREFHRMLIKSVENDSASQSA